MKVILMLVSSLNGKITRGEDSDVTKWSSVEDAKLFQSARDESTLIVMGRRTYETAKKRITLVPRTLRIVLTHNPDRYKDAAKPGMLEFTSEPPDVLVDRLSKAGHKQMLLLGGGKTAGEFLSRGLVNELHLTIEPYMFSQKGVAMVQALTRDVQLKLVEYRQLNKRGTLFVRYNVV